MPTSGQKRIAGRLTAAAARCVSIAVLAAMGIAATAHAGTYTIYDCPSAGSSSAGPWQVSGGTTQKTTCSGGLGDFLGLLTGSMPADATWAMSVTAPQGETLTESSIYWYVTGKSSGGNVFSEEWSGGSELENGENTFDARYVPDTHALPSGATSIVIGVYCSFDDYSNPCNYTESQTPAIAMFGSAITVSDPTPPTGGLTGGGLDGNGPVAGTQSISYNTSDPLAGIYSVQLLVDGNVVATNSYASGCSFTNFLPCPASESGSLAWDTASIPNGAHEIELLIKNAAGDTTVIGDHAITTNNGSTITPEQERMEKEKAEKERAEKEKVEREKAGFGGSNGVNGSNGSNGASGAGGSVTVDVAGSNKGAVLLGSNAKWRVSLKVAPLRVRRHTKIKLSGSVATSLRPSEGKLIYLQARSVSATWKGRASKRHRVTVFGKWVTFQALRAKSNGTFVSTYTFKLGGRHVYQFQAVAPAEGQYRNPTGTSAETTVREI
jgi:hypothetical protein